MYFQAIINFFIKNILIKNLYQLILSPLIHLIVGPFYGCRFVPTCSEYSAEAYETHGIRKGTLLSLYRIFRCHPLSRAGFDPVPRDM